MIKFRLYLDKDSEEDWLKKMCLNGWAFKKFFIGFYKFDKCKPGEFNYQIDLLDNWKGKKKDYASFMEETEVKVISQWWRWVYLQKNSSDGPFEMYTDLDSKIDQYARIKKFFTIALIVEAVCFFIELLAILNANNSYVYLYFIFIVLIALFCLALFRVVWKCNWKIKEYKRQKDM